MQYFDFLACLETVLHPREEIMRVTPGTKPAAQLKESNHIETAAITQAFFSDSFDAEHTQKPLIDTLYSVNADDVIARIASNQDYYANAYRDVTKGIVDSEAFTKNPVAFLVKWRQEHGNARLLAHDWMNERKLGLREGDGHEPDGPRTKEEYAIAGIARQVMADPFYVGKFITWSKTNIAKVTAQQFSAKTPPEVFKILRPVILRHIASDEFLRNLNALRDGILGVAPTEARRNLGSLLFLDCGTLFDDSDTMVAVDVIQDAASRSIKDLVRNYFDLAGKRPSLASMLPGL